MSYEKIKLYDVQSTQLWFAARALLVEISEKQARFQETLELSNNVNSRSQDKTNHYFPISVDFRFLPYTYCDYKFYI